MKKIMVFLQHHPKRDMAYKSIALFHIVNGFFKAFRQNLFAAV